MLVMSTMEKNKAKKRERECLREVRWGWGLQFKME